MELSTASEQHRIERIFPSMVKPICILHAAFSSSAILGRIVCLGLPEGRQDLVVMSLRIPRDWRSSTAVHRSACAEFRRKCFRKFGKKYIDENEINTAI